MSSKPESATRETTPVTVGTAGHIDHGKTQLVEQLTGMRADRPYERERGMTIDIGYAEMRAPGGRRVGFVDLPGHERFIRNMVAGATGIDLVLFVVAADDGVMPQTREHMEILGLLGVNRGVVVLNKIDLVDSELRELALEELREFLAGTVLNDAPLLACSAATGEGVEEIRTALLAMVGAVDAVPDPGSFFLSVQRRFAATGFGCIVNGVPSAGRVALGDELELLPAGKKARVRGIEIYHEQADRARAGHRTSLNLAGVHHEEVARGMVVAEPGVFRPSRHLAVRLDLLTSAKRGIKHAGDVRLLSGTLEEMATVYMLEGDALKPGEGALVEARTATPVVVRDGNPFILRSANAKETLGGGVIVASLDRPIGRRRFALHESLRAWEQALPDPGTRLRAALLDEGTGTAAALARRCQLERTATADLLEKSREEGALVAIPGGAFAPADAIERGVGTLREALAAMHRENPYVAALPLAEARDRAGLSEALVGAVLDRLGDEVVAEARTLRLATHSVQLDEDLNRAAEALLEGLERARFAPPPVAEVGEGAGLAPGRIHAALTFLTDTGAVREVAPGMVYGKRVLDEGIRLLKAVGERRGSGFEPVDAKAVLGGISRKWLIPLLEYYDRIGATRRDGNQRLVTRRGTLMADEGIDAR
ncbi:MAG: selenocysteine-specific translation elongation factor [Planctomycetota bacterium]|jgi:selenocysteine-specific elongation factor